MIQMSEWMSKNQFTDSLTHGGLLTKDFNLKPAFLTIAQEKTSNEHNTEMNYWEDVFMYIFLFFNTENFRIKYAL